MAKRLKDVDSAEVAYRLKIITWTLPIALAGTAAGGFLGGLIGGVIGFAIAGPGVYFFALAVVERGGHLASQVYAPDGASTPHKQEFSQAESLVARGRYEEAVVAFEIHCAEYPDDPDPYFRLARLYASKMERYEDAVA